MGLCRCPFSMLSNSLTKDVLPIFIYLPEPLNHHLERNNVEYLQFAFRWMNNLLMREMPLRCTIRLWDTYLVCIYKENFPNVTYAVEKPKPK